MVFPISHLMRYISHDSLYFYAAQTLADFITSHFRHLFSNISRFRTVLWGFFCSGALPLIISPATPT